MSLNSLPLELLDVIISYVDSPRHVSALSLSCRALHSACNTWLLGKKFDTIRICPDDFHIEKAFQLLMEILRTPRLGLYVREIRYYGRPDVPGGTLRDWTERYKSEQSSLTHSRDLEESDLDLLRGKLELAGFSGIRNDLVLEFLVQKKTGDKEGQANYLDTDFIGLRTSSTGVLIAQALAVALISASSNLVSLAMTQPWKTWFHRGRDTFYPLEYFLLQANSGLGSKPYLQNLRDVYIMTDENGPTEWGEPSGPECYTHIDFLDCFKMFDKLPSIESVGIDGFTDNLQDEPTNEHGASKLTKIYINHSTVEPLYLARAILSSKALKEFQYSIGGRGQLDIRGSINNRTLSKAILTHKGTLEVFDIDSDTTTIGRDFHYHSWGPHYDNEGEDQLEEFLQDDEEFRNTDDGVLMNSFWQNQGSLKDFVALRSLSLGIGLLLYLAKGANGVWEENETCSLVDCLPRNLEYLCIRGYQRGEVPRHDVQVDALMAAYNAGSLRLKDIRGVDSMVPISHHEEIDCDEELRWSLQRSGYGLSRAEKDRIAERESKAARGWSPFSLLKRPWA